MKQIKARIVGRRVTAFALCLCMIMSLISGMGLIRAVARAAGGTTASGNGPTSGATRQADPSTMDTYQQMLDFSTNTRYAGRLWSDKTVFALGDSTHSGDADWNGTALSLTTADDGVTGEINLNEDFLHVFSALGSSLKLDDSIKGPYDVVILLDMSGSMLTVVDETKSDRIAKSRIGVVLDSINTAIDKLMEMHETNRVAVIGYGATAYTLMELGHYKPDWEDGTYLKAENLSIYGNNSYYTDPDDFTGTNGAYTVHVKAKKEGNEGTYSEYERKARNSYINNGISDSALTLIGFHTNLQAGIWQGFNELYKNLTNEPDSYSYTYESKLSGEKTQIPRVPVAFVMTDGGSNLALGNASDVTGNEWHNLTIPDRVSGGDSWYTTAGNRKYRSEGDAHGQGVILDILLTASYMKSKIINKYHELQENIKDSPENAARMAAWDFSIHSISVDTPTSAREIPRVYAALDPKVYFNEDPPAIPGRSDWPQKEDVTEAYKSWQEWIEASKTPGNHIKAKVDTSEHGGKDWEFKINTLSEEQQTKEGVTNQDVIDNILYNDSFADIGAGDLSGYFEQIIGQLGQELFSPVGGENDLGVNDAVTYMDPIGKYMDVKDVTNLSLFGTLYDIVKTAVYDYQWNHQYMANLNRENEPLDEGWYKGDPTASGNNGVTKYEEKDGNYYPDGCQNIDEAWAAGWVYRVNYQTASQYVPTLESINSSEKPDATTAKQQHTVYTFYRIAGTSKGDPMTDDYLTKLHMNPAYGDAVPASAGPYDEENQTHLNTPGVYALIDIRIWTEDSGDYSVTDTGDTLTDNNYDEALWVNVPVNMLPLRRVTVIAGDEKADVTYDTNIPSNTSDLTAAETASFPLRLFYTVGVSDEALEASNRVNIAGAISAEYIKENKVTSQAAETVRNVPQGNLEFFSNWYNPLNRYNDYATTATDYTYGDPVVSFSPSTDNRYYSFEKALPLYSAAYRFDGTNWKAVKIGDTADEANAQFVATGFGGRLIAQDLEANDAGGISAALQQESITPAAGDIVFLKKDRLTDVEVKTGEKDPFSSDGYYFLAIEFFNLTAGTTIENADGTAARTQFAITRKGSEFGSGYGSAGIKNGDMLCWHDMSGQYEDQPYVSYTDTGDPSRGKPDATKFSGGEWVVSAKKGGLRVGDLAQNVKSKGDATTEEYQSIEPGVIKEFSAQRYPGDSSAENLTWGYYPKNVTRTANNYYMPTISTASSLEGGNDIIVNVYLGNNGRLYVSDTTLLVTKRVDPAGMTIEDLDKKEFNFQVFIANTDKNMSAIVVHWNENTNSWQRQFHTIDLELDGKLFLQTPDGAKAMVDSTGKRVINSGDGYQYADGDQYNEVDGPYYVYIGKNRTKEEVGASSTGFRVYHNSDVDEAGSVSTEDVTSVPDGDKTTYKATKVWLVSVSEFEEKWANQDPVGDGFDIEKNTNLYNKELAGFELLTLDPTAAGTEVTVTSPYRTASAYWTKELTFGINSNEDGGPGTVGSPLTKGDLYDSIIPVADRPDYFADLDNDTIAQNTAEFTLKDGEGLLFSGISSNSVYRVTEKLTKEDMDAGYTLKQVSHNQQVGSTSTYQPGVQSIPVYYHDGATYGEIYPSGTAYMPEAYRSNNTQYGLTWAVKQGGSKNEEGYLHYEPFFNTNAVVVEAYSTFAPDAAGDNHHQPTTVTDGTSVFWLWHSDTNQNTNEGGTYTVLDNPSCTALNHENLAEGGCDDTLADGQIRHYFFKDGVLLDQHYYGEGSGYLRDFARFVTSPTVHFAVKDENPQDNRNPADYNFTSSTDYTGAYSVFGNTGTYEESANFVNTVEPGTLSVTKELAPKEKLTDEDKEKLFDFTLTLTEPNPDTGIKGPTEGYPYTITIKDKDASGKEEIKTIKSGLLIPNGATSTDENDIEAEPEGTWKFQLKGGQTFTVDKIPGKTGYTVMEDKANGFKTDVQVGEGAAKTDSTASGTVTPGAANQTKILFTNIKDKPALLSLVKKLTVKLYGGAQFKWRFEFTVTPDEGNDAASDPIRKRAGFKDGVLTLTMDFNVTTDGEHSQDLVIFDNDAFTQEGTYTYTIKEKETDTAIPGMKYDDRVYEVEVKVTKGDVDTEGRIQLVATLTLTLNGENVEKVAFANDYDVARIVQTFDVQKELKDSAGNPLSPAAGEFSFILEAKDCTYSDGDKETGTSPMPKGVTDSPYTVPNAAGGKVLFGEVEFTRPGTYNYTIKEDVPQSNASPGYVYDKTVYNVTVVVERQSGGSLGTKVTYKNADTSEESTGGITFTNTVDLGSLTVSKTVTGLGNKDKEFHFTVTFTPAVGLERAVITKNGSSMEAEITGGKLEFDLKHGEYVEITGLPAGTEYRVMEDNYTGEGYTTSSSNASGTIPPNSTADAAFVNDRQESKEPGKGNLKVSKTVTGEGDTNKDFSFTVTLSGTSVDGINGEEITGQYGDIHFTDGVATFTLKHNQSVVATGLPAGITYVVTEDAEDDYDTSEHGEPKGIIPDGGTAEASYVNDFGKVLEPKDRALQVTKTVLGDAGDPAKEWHFTVTLFKDGTVDTSVTGTYGDMTFTNGVAEFTLKSGEKALAESLPEGDTYEVVETEANQDGYTTTVSGDTGTITENGTANADFINRKDPPPEKNTGNLTVSKTVTGNGGNKTKYFNFHVELSDKTVTGTFGNMTFRNGIADFTLKHGESLTANGLPAGITYTVTEAEADQDGYHTTSAGDRGTIPDGGTARADFVNSKSDEPGPEKGNLTVTKLVSGTAGDTGKEWHFTVTLSDTSVNGDFGGMTFTDGVAEFTLKSGESATATGLPAGVTYTVTETEANADGYETTSTGESGKIPDNDTAYADFVNSKDTPEPEFGGLTVTKTVTAGDMDKDWHFTVTLSGMAADGTRAADINGIYGGMFFTNGVAEFTLKHNESLTAEGLPAGITYTVTEFEANADGYTTTSTGESGTIPTDGKAEAKFVNRRNTTTETGGLTVTKTVTGTAGDKSKEWHFRVELSDKTVNGDYGEMEFTNGVATFTLKHGQSLTAEDLPAGITYTVTETEANKDDYITSSSGASGTIPAGGTARAEFTNYTDEKTKNPGTGNLTVTKTVTAGELEKEWHFTVALSDTTVNGDYGQMTFTNGVAEFALKSGESKTATGLPDGITYTVTENEANQDGYTTTSTGASGTIEKGDTSRAEFFNRNDTTTTTETGDLTVTKTVTGTAGDTAKAWHFTVELSDKTVNGIYGDMIFTDGEAEFTLKSGESMSAEGLPAGITYTVTEFEANADGYTTTSTGANGTITANGQAEAKFENSKDTTEPKYGNLTVSKTVTGTGDTTKEWNFTVELSNKDITGTYDEMEFTNGVAEFTLKSGESKTANRLPAGITYTVTEAEAHQDGYTTGSTGAVGTIPENGTAKAEFTNSKGDTTTPKTGDLTVTKTVTGNAGETAKEWHFTVTFTPAEGLESAAITKNGSPLEAEITGGELSFTLKHGEYVEIKGLPAGITYTVTEKEADEDDYHTASAGDKGTIPDGGTTQANFVNNKNTETEPGKGNLTVTKLVSGTAGDTSKVWHFTVTLSDTTISGAYGEMTFKTGAAEFTLKSGESKTATGLPANVTYTVTETEANQDGYTTESTGESGTIPDKDTAYADFVNSKDAPEPEFGGLTVSKTVTGNAGDYTKAWHFTVELSNKTVNGIYGGMIFTNGVTEFTLKHGESLTAEGLPAGITYTVTEFEANKDGYTTTSTNASGAIPENGTANVEFVNTTTTPKTGDLTVSKTVTGAEGDKSKEWHFRVELSDKSINGTYGGMTFTDGVAEVTLKHGQSKTAENLPAGITYTVTEREAHQDGYTTGSTGAVGTIPADGTAEAKFTNSKGDTTTTHTGDLTVSKTVTGTAGDKNKNWNFRVELRDKSVNGDFGEMTFRNGVAEFTLKSGESLTATGLPAGITYTVTEEEANEDGYTTGSTGFAGTIPANGEAEAKFTNHKGDTTTPKTGGLTVTKTVTGNAGDTTKVWHFTVTLSDTSISGTYGGMTFTDGVANFTLKHGESLTATGLPAGITYTVTEEEANADGYHTTIAGDKGTFPDGGTARADFVNSKSNGPGPKLGNLTVTKLVSGTAGDTNKEWHFTVTLSDETISGTYGEMTFTNGVANFTLKHKQSVTATGLPAGITYTVTETEANKDGYHTTSTGASGTIPENDTANADFVNSKDGTTTTPKTGSLTVSKTVTGGEVADGEVKFHFTVTLSGEAADGTPAADINGKYGDMFFVNGVAQFDLTDGERKTASGLPAGLDYTVTETTMADFTPILPEGGSTEGIIPGNGTARADFVNRKDTVTKKDPEPGSLTVTKTVTGDAGEFNREWHFRVELSDKSVNGTYGGMTFTNGVATFTLKSGDSVTADGLPAGVGYKVTETGANKDGYTTEITGDSGTISKGTAVWANFINSKDPPPEEGTGDLVVTKTVTGDAGDRNKPFHFTVTLEGDGSNITGTYGGMTFTNGVAEFTLKHGQSKTAKGLPAGLEYTVTETEANKDGYYTQVTGDKGTIPDGDTARADYVNSMDPGLTVEKMVVDPTPEDLAKDWHFEVKLTPPEGDPINWDALVWEHSAGRPVEIDRENSTLRFVLRHGEHMSFGNIPLDTHYEVTEAEANVDPYRTTVDKDFSPAEGLITLDPEVWVRFLNEREDQPDGPRSGEGRLRVEKQVSGTTGETEREWHFSVELSRPLTGQYGNMYFVNGVAEFTLKNGESLTAMGLPAGVTYTVTEAEANRNGYTTETSGETGAIPDGGTAEARFINSRGETPPTEPDDTTPEPDDTTPGPDDTTPGPDNPPETPKTGDDSHLGLWAALMALSLVGVAATSISLFGRRSLAGTGKWRVASFKGKHRRK